MAQDAVAAPTRSTSRETDATKKLYGGRSKQLSAGSS
jgi:hypothetical protein